MKNYLIAMSFCAAVLVPAMAAAAPVTFQFEAAVASVRDSGGGAGLPFSLAVGDAILSEFILDSFNGGPQYLQNGSISFDFLGQKIYQKELLVTVSNNQQPDAVPLKGAIADPLNTPIVDQGPGISDGISLSCNHTFGLTCEDLGDEGDVRFGVLASFIGNQGILESDSLTTEQSLWNAFAFREMLMTFQNVNTGGMTRIGAYVGTIIRVPEPTSLGLTLLLTLTICTVRGTRFS